MDGLPKQVNSLIPLLLQTLVCVSSSETHSAKFGYFLSWSSGIECQKWGSLLGCGMKMVIRQGQGMVDPITFCQGPLSFLAWIKFPRNLISMNPLKKAKVVKSRWNDINYDLSHSNIFTWVISNGDPSIHWKISTLSLAIVNLWNIFCNNKFEKLHLIILKFH